MILPLIDRLKAWQKTCIAIFYDCFFILFSFYTSFIIRYETFVFEQLSFYYLLKITTLTLVSQALTLYFSGVYRGIWRYSSTPDLLRLIKGVTFSVLVSIIILFFLTRIEGIPRTVFFIDWLLLIMTLGGGRLAYRVVRDNLTYKARKGDKTKNVIIIGAGSSGDQIFREIRTNPSIRLKVVAFLDDDPFKKRKILHGIPVKGTSSQLRKYVIQLNVSKVFIAIPSLTSAQIRNIIDSCNGLNVDFKTLPKFSDIIDGKISFSSLRKVGLEDLLGRNEVQLDKKSLVEMLNRKKILVTGGGGSIGSELCRQILHFSPEQLIIVEQNEFNIFELERSLKALHPKAEIITIVGDVKDKVRMQYVFQKYSPNVVFHAAAYKHVPMMEINAIESILTNVLGTKNIVELSKTKEVEKFVLISTDKAVNPVNVMGASKRVAEMIIQQAQLDSISSKTQFMAVRFGNVLGSSGSVVPIFQKQIQNGGPVTVTDERIRRYFMTIQEACQLVLQAGALGTGGEVFVLDMGNPVKIIDLAKQMIFLSGLTLGKDIEIKITGLRAGEKLYEETFFEGEGISETLHPLVKVSKIKNPQKSFLEKLNFLTSLAHNSNNQEVQEALRQVVVEYNPSLQQDHLERLH